MRSIPLSSRHCLRLYLPFSFPLPLLFSFLSSLLAPSPSPPPSLSLSRRSCPSDLACPDEIYLPERERDLDRLYNYPVLSSSARPRVYEPASPSRSVVHEEAVKSLTRARCIFVSGARLFLLRASRCMCIYTV